MKQKNWIILFVILLTADIIAVQLNSYWPKMILKPLLLPVLITMFATQVNQSSPLKKWVLLALSFSWLGDVLLMFEEKNANFFLFGLAAFLMAHVFYIIFFHLLKKENRLPSKWLLLFLVAIYYYVLISVLSPKLGDMKLPVRIYGLVISFMLVLAAHMLFLQNKKAGKWFATGALLFVISDSVLAINKFYQPIPAAGIWIMLTYGLAQLLITAGAISYIKQKN